MKNVLIDSKERLITYFCQFTVGGTVDTNKYGLTTFSLQVFKFWFLAYFHPYQ